MDVPLYVIALIGVVFIMKGAFVFDDSYAIGHPRWGRIGGLMIAAASIMRILEIASKELFLGIVAFSIVMILFSGMMLVHPRRYRAMMKVREQ
ncbi:MAG: hypothetical protein P8X39_09375 [Desulfofustis sp.]